MQNNKSSYEQDWGVDEETPAHEEKGSSEYDKDWEVSPSHTFIGKLPRNAKLPSFKDIVNRQKEISSEFRKQLTNPQAGKEFLKGIGQGIVNIPNDVTNLAIMGGNFLNKPFAKPVPLNERFKIAPETTAAQTGDVLSGLLPLPSAISKLGPAIGSVAGSALSGPASAAKRFGSGLKNIVPNALGTKVPKLEREAEEALRNADLAKAQEEQIKGYTGQQSEEAANKDLFKKKEELAGMEQPEVNNLPIQSSRESGANLDRATAAHENATSHLADTENQISQHLNQGTAHDVHLAEQIVNHQEGVRPPGQPNGRRQGGIRSNISQLYDELINRFSNNHVEIDNSQAINEATQRLRGLIQENRMHTPEFTRLSEQINQLEHAPQRIPADRYLTMLRSAKDYAREARRKAFQPDMNAEARSEWERRYNELDQTIEEMEDRFTQAIDPEDASSLIAANTAWRTQVKPLQRNNTYQTILHRGRIEGNIIEKLRGTDPGDVLMRNMIRNNPEMSRNIIGSQYADNPTALHNAGELAQEYMGNMPELNNMLENHAGAQRAAERSEQALNQAQRTHRNITQRETEAHRQVERQENKITESNKERKKIQDEIDKIDRDIPLLREAARKKNVSVEKHILAQKKLDKALKDRKKARVILGSIGGTIFGAKKLGIIGGINQAGAE